MRTPYMPCDWLCAIHYLTDVEPGAPCFCVVPGSNRFETLEGRRSLRARATTYAEGAALRPGRDLCAL